MEFKNWLQGEESKRPESKNLVLVNDGSFNPIHRGHIQVTLAAKQAAEGMGYNVVGLYMTPKHGEVLQKKFQNRPGETVISDEDRLEMVRRAAQGTGIVVHDWEIKSGRFQTDPEMKAYYEKLHPGAIFVNILGEDYGSCAPMPCFGIKDEIWHIRMPRTGNLSSTRIRLAAKSGSEDIESMLPTGVGDYLKNKNILPRQAGTLNQT